METFCPFVGLRPFSEEDREYFFGRKREKRIICSNALTAPLTVLYGPSGAGKSSVLGAGVLPEMNRESGVIAVYFHKWQGEGFLAEWKRACLACAGRTPESNEPAAFDAFLETILRKTRKTMVLIVDQFEEYLLYHAGAQTEGGFEAEFARVVNRTDLDVNVLIGIREDSISRLDRFKARIPNLLANTLRLEQLNTEAASEAIRKPLEVFNEKYRAGLPPVTIEDELVTKVVADVRTGQVRFGASAGIGAAKTGAPSEQVETAFLQLVMTRIWEAEMANDSRVLRLETLENLGGAQHVVESYVDDVMKSLTHGERDCCARMFHYLVTPSRMKVAQDTASLVYWAETPRPEVEAVLKTLDDARVLKRMDEEPQRYEIFHDVLAGAVLDWSTRYKAASEATRLEKRRRSRFVAAALGLAALATAVAGVAALNRENETKVLGARIARAEAEAKNAALVEDADRRNRDAELARRLAEQTAAFAKQRELLAENQRRAEHQSLLSLQRQVNLRLAAQATAFSNDALARDPKLAASLALYAVQASEAAAASPSPESQQAILHVVASQEPEMRLNFGGHTSAVRAVAFNPDGSRFATGSYDRTAKIWDAATGENILTLAGHRDSIFSVAFSPDGNRLATASSDKTVKIWDTHSGANVTTLTGPSDMVWGVAFSPDGATVAAASKDGKIHIWRVEGEIASQPCCEVAGGVFGLAFDRGGTRLASAGYDNNARLWDWKKSELTRQFIGHTGKVESVEFDAARERIVTASADDTARIWKVSDGKTMQVLTGHTAPVVTATFSPDGKLAATGSNDRSARIWDAATGKLLVTLSGHSEGVWGIAFDPKRPQRIVTASSDHSVKVWDTGTGRLIMNLEDRGAGTVAAAFSRNGTLVTSAAPAPPQATSATPSAPEPGYGATAQIWDEKSGHVKALLDSKGQALNDVAISADGSVAASAGEDNTVRVWDARSGNQEVSFPAAGAMEIVALSADGNQLAAFGKDGAIHMWNLRSRRSHKLDSPGAAIRSLALNADGSRLLAGTADGAVELRGEADGAVLCRLTGHSRAITRVNFSPNGELALAASEDGTVIVWDASTGRARAMFSEHGKTVVDAVFSPDGEKVASAGLDGTVRIWLAASGSEICSYNAPRVMRLDFSDGGRVTAYDQTARLREYPVSFEQAMTAAKGMARQPTEAEFRHYFGQGQFPALK